MRIGILGGSFNPVHVGHMRLALELLESCPYGLHGPKLDRVDLIPCAQPPHKPTGPMLPFDLRLNMLKASVQGVQGLSVNDLEGRRSGPSYTWDTLTAYRENCPEARLLFVVGGEDYGTLCKWHRGLELPYLADIAMVPRAGVDHHVFCQQTERLWPAAKLAREADSLYAELPQGGRLIYLPLLRLDVSASLIRRRWLKGRDVRYLMPDAALRTLQEASHTANLSWQDSGEA